jgi:hypothetical protein
MFLPLAIMLSVAMCVHVHVPLSHSSRYRCRSGIGLYNNFMFNFLRNLLSLFLLLFIYLFFCGTGD